MTREIVVSGIRPTGFLHLGNYFGAVANYVAMQERFECYFFVADWHSLTTHPDTKELQHSVNKVLAENIACGIDPEKAALYVQSDVPEIAELYLYLNTLSYKGELEKTVTFKEKARLQPDNINAGLLTYPVLQAADILIQRAVKVPVGKDQEQHLEMARNFAERFNYRYGEVFPLPYAFNQGEALLKILSLDGNGKMSKSENQMNTIYLSDDRETIKKKVMKARTDQGPAHTNSEMPPYIENLFTLLRKVSQPDIVAAFEHDYAQSFEGSCKIKYGDLKKQLAIDLDTFIAPIREKTLSLLNNPTKLTEIRNLGAEKARKNAKDTLLKVREAMGLRII